MIIATAPGACGLVGTPADVYGGCVISCSTRERARCELAPSDGPTTITVHGRSQAVAATADLALRDDPFLNAARAALLALEVDPTRTEPFHLAADTEIPMRAGLAGAAALLAAIVGCVLAHLGLRLNPYEVAELVRKIESDVLGVHGGFQDYYMTTFGGLHFLDFRDKDPAQTQDATTPLATVEPLDPYVAADPPLVLAVAAGAERPGAMCASPSLRGPGGEESLPDGYLEAARCAQRGKRALLACDWAVLGDLMSRSHAAVRGTGRGGEAGERLIAAALGSGALGAKLAGAGGGGVLALTLDKEATVAALRAAGAETILYPRPAPGLTIEMRV